VDTNVLARFVLADDAGQHRRAVAALEADEDLFIPVTVLLELARVLGARDASRAEITSALRRIVGLPRAHAQHPEAVRCGASSTGWRPGWTSRTRSTWP
jgi:predicted nucleic acid-binding protein